MGCTSTHKVNKFEVLALVTSLRCQEVFGIVYAFPDVCCNKLKKLLMQDQRDPGSDGCVTQSLQLNWCLAMLWLRVGLETGAAERR